MRSSGPLVGKSGVADALVGLFELLTSLCVRASVSNVSVWFLGLSGLPMCGSAVLAGKSGLTDVFTGLFKLFPALWICMCAVCVSGQLSNSSASSRHNLVLPVGELGVLLCWARTDAFLSVSSRNYVHCKASVRTFSMPARPLFFCFGFTSYLPSSLLAPGPLYAWFQGSWRQWCHVYKPSPTPFAYLHALEYFCLSFFRFFNYSPSSSFASPVWPWLLLQLLLQLTPIVNVAIHVVNRHLIIYCFYVHCCARCTDYQSIIFWLGCSTAILTKKAILITKIMLFWLACSMGHWKANILITKWLLFWQMSALIHCGPVFLIFWFSDLSDHLLYLLVWCVGCLMV